MIIASILIAAFTAPVIAAAIVYSCEIILGLRRSPNSAARQQRSGGNAVIVIPAHDEKAAIGATVAKLLGQLGAGTRILVVADNCTDSTARIAQAAGADVIERFDASMRGKGHALAFARDHLKVSPPDQIIVMDADCWFEDGSIAALLAVVDETGAPVQCTNLLWPDASPSPVVQASNFAFLLKNFYRQKGLKVLGAPALLTGTGMAFPWPVFRDAPLASSSIVEDLELGVELCLRGVEPMFLETATIWSNPNDQSATIAQRSRWEGGFLRTAPRGAARLVRHAFAHARPRLIWLALHLLTPPLTLLLLWLAIGLAAAIALSALGGSFLPLALVLGSGGLVVIALLLAWLQRGRQFITGASLLRLPGYVAWKIPMYLKLIGNRPTWDRSRRN